MLTCPQELMAVLRRKLSGAVEACTFPPWPLSVTRSHPRFVLTLGQRCVDIDMLNNASTPSFTRFGRALRVLKSIVAFRSVLPPGLVKELALGHLIQVRVVVCFQCMC